MYKIGDYVVYRILTVCKIVEIETPSFELDKEKEYYKLSPVFDNVSATTIYVPADNVDGLRSVSSKQQIEEALSALPSLRPTVCSAKKPPQLTAYYQDRLSLNDLSATLSLLKEISIKEKTSNKKLSEIDLRFRKKIDKLLCEEFAVVFNETPERIKEKIYKLI